MSTAGIGCIDCKKMMSTIYYRRWAYSRDVGNLRTAAGGPGVCSKRQ